MTLMPPPPWRLNLIGAGRVGQTLARLWQGLGDARPLVLQDVLTRHPASATQAVAQIGAGTAVKSLAQMRAADVWLIATPDAELAPQAERLAAHLRQQPPQPHGAPPLVWHCSGFWPADVLAPLRAAGCALASVHPALSFAEPARAMLQFPGTACALEGDPLAVAAARSCFDALGGRCFELAAADKPRYHAAAVLASNFLPVLQAAAAELWQGCGMPADLVAPLWQGFVQQVSANLLQLGPAAALTGPAARGDQSVVQAETVALQQRDPALAAAYAALSELAGRLARTGQVLPPA
jgi:predicted short-subunit dehydrogenase-like oxidoreductase (DUF2520 family)